MTYEQILTMLVRVCGEEETALEAGGYPDGYIAVAKNLGITQGVTVNIGAQVSGGTVAMFVFNSMSVEDSAQTTETGTEQAAGTKTETENQGTREISFQELVVVDNDQVSVIVTGYDPDSTRGFAVNLYLVNKTDKELMFGVDDESVNGYMADPFWASSVLPGQSEFSSITWSDSTLEKNGITSIEEIEMVFRVYDADNWLSDYIINETVKLNP